MDIYQTLRNKHTQAYSKLSFQYNLISLFRVGITVLFFICLYYYSYQSNAFLAWGMGLSAFVFLIFIKIHENIGWDMRLRRTLMRINTDEINYLAKNAINFADGAEYNTSTHAYAHDLDIFGKNSLFQHLNRTATHVGKTTLANLLLACLPTPAIKRNQEAIQELKKHTAWRQMIYALGKMNEDTDLAHQKLIAWSETAVKPVHPVLLGLSYILPAIFWSLCGMAWFTNKPVFGGIALLVFLFNLLVLLSQLGKIKKETQQAENIDKFLKQYSSIIACLENATFESALLQDKQAQLAYQTGKASRQVQALSAIFHQLDSLDNVIGALFFNGSLLYHIRVWHNLSQWKAQYAQYVPQWLAIIGEIEALNSIANFAYNHTEYVFPALNDTGEISFQNVAHPLLNPKTSIKNDIAFQNFQFIVLTGSNMSGKSTFLRTLGVNMVLAGIGAPICASQANIHPLPVWVSMRLSDSLQDSESYFFAEVKRLKEIMTAVQAQTCFVLLDEILRGTNSDDKRSGTIGVIKKIIAQRAFGAIATHDIEVCLTTADYPAVLTNKCFEVEIIKDELVFDYKLRDGVCQNKSATFLMKKMEII